MRWTAQQKLEKKSNNLFYKKLLENGLDIIFLMDYDKVTTNNKVALNWTPEGKGRCLKRL